MSQLERSLEEGLTLISAPAGYGKTTLVADWLRQLSMTQGQRSSIKSAWVSLDETDNELDIFLRYVITAVQTVFPGTWACENTESLLDTVQAPPLNIVANAFINDLNAVPAPLFLALDDYHLITDPAIHQLMSRLARYLPRMLRLLLITRVDPPFPLLARRRAQGRLVEIRAADLRFTPVEAYAVLRETTDTAVTMETAVALDTETEGWIIGLQMAGLSLRYQTDPAAFARSLRERGRRLAMDFLLDEVLSRQPRSILEFLLQTAILERFCAALCTAVINSPEQSAQQAQDSLDQLERTNLFLVPLDERGEWYRYHHLFRQLLQQRLVQEYEPEKIADLHRRAGAWLAEHRYTQEALRHLLAAGDVEAAVSLIEASRREVLNQEDFHTLERSLGMLPERVVSTRPSLLLLKAWVLRLQFKLETLPLILQQVDRVLAAEANGAAEASVVTPDILRGERDVLWSEIYFWNSDFQRSRASGRSALALLPRNHFFTRGLAVYYKCQALQAVGQFDQAVTLLNEMLADEQVQHLAFRSRMLIAAASVYGAAGDLQHMKQVCQFLLELGQAEHSSISLAWGHYGLGFVYYHWNLLAEARDHWASVPKFRYHIHFRAYHEAMLGLAFVQQHQGEADHAQQTLDSLEKVLLEMGQSQLVPEVAAFRARLALQQGGLATAVQWAETTSGPHYLPTWFWETSELTRVKVYIAQGTAVSLQKAASLLHTSQQAAEQAHQTNQLIEIWALRALVEVAQDNLEAALAACRQAVELAEPGGFLRIFVDLGSAMADLLRQLAVRGISVAYIGTILAAFPGSHFPSLTEQEEQILALLQQGLSNKKIAQQLVISLNTVKKHNRNIYQKLGVHSRDQAITQAEALGLL